MKTLAFAARGTRRSLHCSIAILTLALSIGPGCGDDRGRVRCWRRRRCGQRCGSGRGCRRRRAGCPVRWDRYSTRPMAASSMAVTTAAMAALPTGSRDWTLSPPDLVDAPPREWVLLTDFEGNGDLTPFWALFVGGTMTGDSGDAPTGALVPARGSSRQAMHLQGPAVADGAVINTHQNFDWTALFTGVRFWARGTGDQPTEILVALTDLRSPTELYYAGLRAESALACEASAPDVRMAAVFGRQLLIGPRGSRNARSGVRHGRARREGNCISLFRRTAPTTSGSTTSNWAVVPENAARVSLEVVASSGPVSSLRLN